MKNEDVSNEQVLIDIKNTKDEIRAHTMIAEGNRILSGLPEADVQDRAYHRVKIIESETAADCSARLLTFLLSLAEERGITDETIL